MNSFNSSWKTVHLAPGTQFTGILLPQGLGKRRNWPNARSGMWSLCLNIFFTRSQLPRLWHGKSSGISGASFDRMFRWQCKCRRWWGCQKTSNYWGISWWRCRKTVCKDSHGMVEFAIWTKLADTITRIKYTYRFSLSGKKETKNQENALSSKIASLRKRFAMKHLKLLKIHIIIYDFYLTKVTEPIMLS